MTTTNGWLSPDTASVSLDGLDSWPTDRIRDVRRQCERDEAAVSYARRVAHVRMDVLAREVERRRQNDPALAGAALDGLVEILAARPAARGQPMNVRPMPLNVPPGSEEHEAAIDRIVPPSLTLAETDLAALEHMCGSLAELEGALSQARRALFARIDALGDELARRYKDGRASPSELLGGASD